MWEQAFPFSFLSNPPWQIKKHDRRVLDVGCGRGFVSLGPARIIGEKGRVIAADLQPEMLQMVRERSEKYRVTDRIEFHQCRDKDIGVSENVDFALAFWMAHEVPDTEAFLKKIYSLLKPGGRFFVAEPVIHVSRKVFERMIQKAILTRWLPLS